MLKSCARIESGLTLTLRKFLPCSPIRSSSIDAHRTGPRTRIPHPRMKSRWEPMHRSRERPRRERPLTHCVRHCDTCCTTGVHTCVCNATAHIRIRWLRLDRKSNGNPIIIPTCPMHILHHKNVIGSLCDPHGPSDIMRHSCNRCRSSIVDRSHECR